MILKSFLTFLAAAFITININAQSVVRVILNNKRVAQFTASESSDVCEVKIKNYKNVKQLSIFINPNETSSGPFKRGLEITDENDDVLYVLEETKTQSRKFNFNIPKLKKIVAAHKHLKMYVTEDPANPMMMIRSARFLVAQVRFK
ncbi:hypothetical protein BH09BAC2_BH09BAC2_05520 [soil metagenome]